MPETHKLSIPEIAISKWRSISDLLAEMSGVPAAGISIIEEETLHIISGSLAPDGHAARDKTIKLSPGLKVYCAAVVHSRDKLVVPNSAASEFWKDSEGVKSGFIAYAGVPIFQPDNEIFGALCLFDRKPNTFEGPILRLMQEFAEIITGHLELIKKNVDLEQALKDVRTLQGLIPICAQCKKIRDDKGFWQKVEVYLEGHSQARFTHGLCEDCMQKLYGHEKWYKEKEPGK